MLYVRHALWNISVPSSAKQKREISTLANNSKCLIVFPLPELLTIHLQRSSPIYYDVNNME